jgi:asparagine synthase (glutamine-hydrolysing)
MVVTLAHRGPDDSGVWVDSQAGVALGHRRLSIVDLSPAGHQPMSSWSGRYVITFNGEIYNFPELRTQLDDLGHVFRGTSDTEVMLAAMERWGVIAATEHFNGMFAYAVWDREERLLHLARDRFGEKPLYYGWSGQTFLFASELKAIRAHPEFRPQLNRDALAVYVRHGYVPSPLSIYRGIHKLPPATILTVNPQQAGDAGTVHRYWSLRATAESGLADPIMESDAAVIEQFEQLLRDAVRMRMVADVPLGAFLSGGIDSSTVVALMQAQSSRPVKTFSIGFDEAEYDEAHFARGVATHLGTDHTELHVRPNEAMGVIASLPIIYDEPFADSSQIPTYLVSRLARESVTVALSGDAGDELLSGYNHYAYIDSIWSTVRRIPRRARVGGATILGAIPGSLVDGGYSVASRALPGRVPAGRNLRRKRDRLVEVLSANAPEEVMRTLVSHAAHPGGVVLGASEPNTILSSSSEWLRRGSPVSRVSYLDTMVYLPDDILAKVDRASMAVSLEARVPLLDHRVVEFTWRLPQHMKVRNGKTKWLLRQVLDRYVPAPLVDRGKKGFGVPVGTWIRGPLRDWAEGLIDASSLKNDGIFNPDPILKAWHEHVTGVSEHTSFMWEILMFQAWLEQSRGAEAPAAGPAARLSQFPEFSSNAA